ncbi:vanadium-dependent haloperoxidase [Flavihumibacter petaseus]|uniref:Putative hydrolase n=1 Tax=Flavihumibacter petaseus NBRC 106054 TaxID=1220578 RepID=A0A0E9MUY0_9BACT|nr:vanadium-dependent haloperoxidase [Flavihumibacter petaseus]GAO41557.1 putative hydrolase [Flavihumibacter petaseus NBRC 106054]
MKLLVVCCSFLLAFAVQGFAHHYGDWTEMADDPRHIHRAVKKMTDIIVHDIYSPPVASRTYAYISVAGYEAGRFTDKRYRSFAGQLHGLEKLPEPEPGKAYHFPMAAVHAILMVGKSMVISEDSVKAYDEQILKSFAAAGMPDETWKNSKAFGEAIAAAILKWASKDNYQYTRSLPKYNVSDDSSTWKPTAPGYMKAVEPHWGLMRTFVIDSAKQFAPPEILPFSSQKGSPFYNMALEVYETSKKLNDEQILIANFWDCNPFKLNVNGHVMYATKKISPGGHWVNIAAMACQQSRADVMKSLDTYAQLCITLADAFIVCWMEKYRSNVVRPETYISTYIDGDWMPILQTPPFPEYTSGHSVVSAASAVVLTRQFGENFGYTDSTEVEFGIPARKFRSFQQAAEEAAISRMYGGIHYTPAIKFGLAEGKKMAELICIRIKTR